MCSSDLFSGLVSDDGSMRSINVDSIAAVDLEEAEATTDRKSVV